MKFYKKNHHFIIGLFAIAIATLFFANQSATLAAEIPREWEFSQRAGQDLEDRESSFSLNAINVDNDGNSYVIGEFFGTGYFGNTTLISNGNQDIFVAKLSNTGVWLWAKNAGSTLADVGFSISVDADGNSYVVGGFNDIVDFGNTTLVSSGSADIFVAKISNTGEWLWAKKAGGNGSDNGYSINIDNDGNSYVIGEFGATVGFGNTTLLFSGVRDVFVAKISNTGEWLWAKKAGGNGFDRGTSISLDNDGNSYVAGYFNNTATFGNTTLISSGNDDIFVAKLSNTGAWLWAKKAGSNNGDRGHAINVDSEGNIYVAGYFSNTANFGGYSLTSIGSFDSFVAKLSNTGAWLWAKNAGGINNDIGTAISVDSDGNSYAVGYFYGSATFGEHSITSIGGREPFVTKLSSTGEYLWAKNAGGLPWDNEGKAIAIDSNDNIYVAGDLGGEINFGEYYLTGAGIFIAKLGIPRVILPDSTNSGDILKAFQKKNYQQSNGDIQGSAPISLQKTNGNIPASLSLKNQGNRLALPINLQFKKSDNSNYDGIIYPPTTHSVSTVDGKPVLSAISVGSTTESLTLTNGAATLSVPVAGTTIGSPVSIYSSQDGYGWTYEKGGIVSEVSGQPYVQFTTDHFTYFAIAGSTGSFVINNDDYSTTSQTVTLTISAPSATGMKFSNDGVTWPEWEAYSTSKSWELSSGYEEKTVYAQFIANGEIYNTSDSILYTDGASGNGTQGNITLTISGGVTECIYGTSLDMNAQDVKIGIPYTFSGTFPSAWYCQDYRGIDGGWTLTIQTTDLTNEKSNVISGSNLLISHDPVVVDGDLACTGNNGTATQFYTVPYEIFEKISGTKKICKVSADNVGLLVNVPANQAPGNYSGTLTLTMNGF